MTPSAALTAIITQLNAAGLKEVRSPIGANAASSQRINQSFSVRPASLRPSGGRGRPDVPGLRVEHRFTIELSHQIKPGLGQEAPSQAMDDLHKAWKYLSAFSTTLTSDAAIIIGAANTAYLGGGAFIVTSFDLSVNYNLTLVI